MSIINVHEAKTHLSRLLERVAEGDEIVLAKSGRPVARLVPIRHEPRRPGRLKGRIRMAEDFDQSLPEAILRPFKGEGD